MFPQRLLIQILPEHIERGRKDKECPVQYAVLGKYPEATVLVSENQISIYTKIGKEAVYQTPPRVREFIERWDKGEEVVALRSIADRLL